MPTPALNREYEKRKERAKELIAAGGCAAIKYWSATDAERLCPKEHSAEVKFEPLEGMVYISEWLTAAKKAVELITRGISLLEPVPAEPTKESQPHPEDVKEVEKTVLKIMDEHLTLADSVLSSGGSIIRGRQDAAKYLALWMTGFWAAMDEGAAQWESDCKDAQREIKRIIHNVLKARDPIVQGDKDEAYHWLYQIASPHFNKTCQGVWTELEKMADYQGSTPHPEPSEQVKSIWDAWEAFEKANLEMNPANAEVHPNALLAKNHYIIRRAASERGAKWMRIALDERLKEQEDVVKQLKAKVKELQEWHDSHC